MGSQDGGEERDRGGGGIYKYFEYYFEEVAMIMIGRGSIRSVKSINIVFAYGRVS